MLNTVTMFLSLPEEKLDLIQQGAPQLHTKGTCTLQELAALLGRMSHAAQNGIWLAPLHYRDLQRVHSAGIARLGCKNLKQSLDLSQEAMRDLEWWLTRNTQNTNAQHLRSPPFDLAIHTDASQTATHIPGILNVDADIASRQFNPGVEWTLDPNTFQKIVDRLYLPDVDLFAPKAIPPGGEVCFQISRSRSNSGRCFSPRLEQVEQFHIPFYELLLRVVKKIQDEKASALVVAPNWPNIPWYPQ